MTKKAKMPKAKGMTARPKMGMKTKSMTNMMKPKAKTKSMTKK